MLERRLSLFDLKNYCAACNTRQHAESLLEQTNRCHLPEEVYLETLEKVARLMTAARQLDHEPDCSYRANHDGARNG